MTSDQSSLPVCGDGPQAWPTKECVAFPPQNYGKGGMEYEPERRLRPQSQVTCRQHLTLLNLPVRLRMCLGRAPRTEVRFAQAFRLPGRPQRPLRLRIRFCLEDSTRCFNAYGACAMALCSPESLLK